MTNADTLAAVDDYIVSGRSVLFTHDTSSFVNVATEQMYCQDNPDGDNGWNPGWLSNQGNAGDFNQVERHWGYTVNQKFRGVLGMDRYGITYNKRDFQRPAGGTASFPAIKGRTAFRHQYYYRCLRQ